MDHSEPALITCATIQSLPKIADRIGDVKALFVDEVHEFASSKSIQSLRLFENAVYRLGFSATPLKTVCTCQMYQYEYACVHIACA